MWNPKAGTSSVPRSGEFGEREGAVSPRRHEEVLAVRRAEDAVEPQFLVVRRETRALAVSVMAVHPPADLVEEARRRSEGNEVQPGRGIRPPPVRAFVDRPAEWILER